MSNYSSLYYSKPCEDNIAKLNCDPCGPREKGRVRSSGFLAKDYVILDPTNPALWTAAALAGKFYALPFTSGKITPEPVMEKGYGSTEEVLVGYKYKAEIEEPNYVANYLFWNSIKNSKNFKFVGKTETQTHISDVEVTIKPIAPIEDDINKNVVWKVEIMWFQENLLAPYDTPPGIFDSCFRLS